MVDKELKPCPFCGGTHLVYGQTNYISTKGYYCYYIKCKTCFAQGPESKTEARAEARAEAITAFDTRQPDKELVAFARKVIDINCFNSEPDGLTIQEQAEELGLIELYTLVEGDDFDDSEWSVGDKQYKFSEILKEQE